MPPSETSFQGPNTLLQRPTRAFVRTPRLPTELQSRVQIPYAGGHLWASPLRRWNNLRRDFVLSLQVFFHRRRPPVSALP
jgi:hypothetical protein